jgi:hypothetical protein
MKSLKLFTVLLAATMLATPVLAAYPADFQDDMVAAAKTTGCFDDQGNLHDWALRQAPEYAHEPRTWVNHATCVLVDHSVHWQFPGGEPGDGDSQVVIPSTSPADAPYVSLDTADYVCPALLPSDQARMDEMLKWTLWAHDLGYKTTEQLNTFRDGFLKSHHCDLIALRIAEQHAAEAAAAAAPVTKIVDPAHAKPGDIIEAVSQCVPGQPCLGYETWTIKSACPARWVSWHGQMIWFTGNLAKDGQKGSTYSDGTPFWLYFNPKTGLVIGIGPFDALDDVCPQ